MIPFLTSFGFWPVQLSLDCCDFLLLYCTIDVGEIVDELEYSSCKVQ